MFPPRDSINGRNIKNKTMKVAERKEVQRQCENVVRSHNTKDIEPGRFEWGTSIGKAWIHVDAMCKSKVASLFVRFDNTERAKELFGHWKVNLHLHETPNFALYVESHLEDIVRQMNK